MKLTGKVPKWYQNLDQMKFWDENLDPGWNEFRPGQNFGPEDKNLALDKILVRVNEPNLCVKNSCREAIFFSFLPLAPLFAHQYS